MAMLEVKKHEAHCLPLELLLAHLLVSHGLLDLLLVQLALLLEQVAGLPSVQCLLTDHKQTLTHHLLQVERELLAGSLRVRLRHADLNLALRAGLEGGNGLFLLFISGQRDHGLAVVVPVRFRLGSHLEQLLVIFHALCLHLRELGLTRRYLWADAVARIWRLLADYAYPGVRRSIALDEATRDAILGNDCREDVPLPQLDEGPPQLQLEQDGLKARVSSFFLIHFALASPGQGVLHEHVERLALEASQIVDFVDELHQRRHFRAETLLPGHKEYHLVTRIPLEWLSLPRCGLLNCS